MGNTTPGYVRILMITLCWSLTATGFAAEKSSRQCGAEGVWIQILGAGGAELTDNQGASGFVVWVDDHARLLVDAGAGTSVAFDQSGARFEDLDAVVLTQLQADHAGDLVAYVAGSAYSERDRPLPVLGPDGNEAFPDTKTFVDRLIGPTGAFPQLADYLTYKADTGYKLSVRNVPYTGTRRWARFGSQNLRLSSIPVYHGDVPAVAWRVEAAGQHIVFTGDFNNSKDVIRKFAADADALVVSHAISENTRGALREQFVLPSQIGSVASAANVRMLILAHRMKRTMGRESQSREAIEAGFKGPVLFGNDMECWGL